MNYANSPSIEDIYIGKYSSNITKDCTLTEAEIEALDEARNAERDALVRQINGCIQKTLNASSINADVVEHKHTHDVGKFAKEKQDEFDVDVSIKSIMGNSLILLVKKLPMPKSIKAVLIAAIGALDLKSAISAVSIITGCEEDIYKRFNKEIPDHDIKIQNVKKDPNNISRCSITVKINK